MRHGADQSAMANYGLERARQFDPYELQQTKAAARTGNVQADIAEKYFPDMVKANLDQAQLRVPQELAALGVTDAAWQYAQQHMPGSTFDPKNGQFISTLHGTNPQDDLTKSTPLDNLRSSQDAGLQYKSMRDQILNELRAAGVITREQHEQWLEGGKASSAPTSNNSVLTGLKPVTAPSVPATSGIAPTGAVRTPTGTGVSSPVNVNPFANVHAGSSSVPAGYGPNAYSDLQKQNAAQAYGIPRNPNKAF